MTFSEITTVVRIFVVSAYSLNPPEVLLGHDKIAGGPLYDLAKLQALAKEDGSLKLWTDKCRKDVRKWFDDDFEHVVALIVALRAADYIDSEWCLNGKDAMAACDAYSLSLMEPVAGISKPVRTEYFLKFAESKTGALVLLVSCHL